MKAISFLFLLLVFTQAHSKSYVLLEDVTEGQAYGFKIGESKLQSFARAKGQFNDDFISTWKDLAGECAQANNEWLLLPIAFSQACKIHLLNVNNWWFYFNGDYLDSIRLTFEGDQLIRIYRHHHFKK